MGSPWRAMRALVSSVDALGLQPAFTPSERRRNAAINRLLLAGGGSALVAAVMNAASGLDAAEVAHTSLFACVLLGSLGVIATGRVFLGRFLANSVCVGLLFVGVLARGRAQLDPVLLLASTMYVPVYFSPRQRLYFWSAIAWGVVLYFCAEFLAPEKPPGPDVQMFAFRLSRVISMVITFSLFGVTALVLLSTLAREEEAHRDNSERLLGSQRIARACGFLVSADGRELTFFQEVEVVFGPAVPRQIAVRRALAALPAGDAREVVRAWVKARRSARGETDLEPPSPVTSRASWVEGREFVVSVAFDAAPHRGTRAVAGVVRDITEQTRAAELIESQRVTLLHKARLAALGEMAAGIAHEINNPLTIILGRAHILASRARDLGSLSREEIEASADRIARTVERISKIVQTMLGLARDPAQDPPVDMPCNLLAEEALALCLGRFHHHGVVVRLEGDGLEAKVSCVPMQGVQILLNLLSNALDAVLATSHAVLLPSLPSSSSSPVGSASGSPIARRWVIIRCERVPGAVELRVIDSGAPLAPHVSERLFQPFFTTKDVGKGVGLGLSISRSLAERNGGRLVCDLAEPNTCFVLTLPASPAG